MEFQKNLLEHCKRKKITLTELARLAGVPQPTLHGWSTGRAVHNLKQLKNVCGVLEIGLHELLFGTPDPFELKSLLLNDVFSGEIQVTIHKIIKKQRPL